MKNKIISDQEFLLLYGQAEHRNRAFEMLMSQYRSKVMRVLFKITRNAEDAQDLFQETFIKIWLGLEKFRGESQLYTWIKSIATNEGLKFLRSRRKMVLVDLEESVHQMPTDIWQNLPYPPEEIEKKLQLAMKSLPAKQLSIFKMRYYNEITYEQMASQTGTSVGGLKASHHLSVKKVKRLLMAG